LSPSCTATLAGRHALVVGASTGIGEAVAHRLAADGAAVTVVARRAEEVRRVRDALPGEGHRHVPADLTVDAERQRLCDELSERNVDVVVTGLRIRRPWAPLRRSDPADFGRELVEHTAYFVDLARALLPAQRRAGFGRWVVLSSAVAAIGGAGQGAYVAHKSALEGLVRTLALEEGRHGITANVVAPGFIETEGTTGAYPAEVRAGLGSTNALGRAGTCEEVAHVVASLVHPLGGYVTGATVPVSGGTELGWAIDAAVREARGAR